MNIKNSLGTFLVVWMPQIHLITVGIIQYLLIGIYICYRSKGNYEMTSQLRTFSNLCATTFVLFYLFFPTIILMFAYPTQISHFHVCNSLLVCNKYIFLCNCCKAVQKILP
jgi:hypothetical protein